jgi:hypothetical protein
MPVELDRDITWIQSPGSSVFQLRLDAYRRASAPVVAVTEDHCHVPIDWAEKILASHAAHADAVAIGGSVENGATSSVLDWGSFFSLQTMFMAPIRSGPTDRINGHINVSYKRSALAHIDPFGGLGALDQAHQLDLRNRGELLIADDSIRCRHVQSLGAIGTAVGHFHAGRTVAGFRRQNMDAIQWGRFALTFVVPFVRFGRVMWIGSRKQHRVVLVLSAPLILWFLMCQAAGQFVGYAAGPGESPRRII